jgi:hypothetical protein
MTTHSIADTRGRAWTRWQGVALALALALTLPRCPGPAPEPPGPPSFRLELGRGNRFEPIIDGETIFLQQGCQGSQMTIVSLRAWELSPLATTVELALTNVATGKKLSQSYRVRLSFSPGSDPEAPAELDGLLLVISSPDQAVGQTVRLTATVESSSGEKVTDSRTGTMEWGPGACQ